MIILNPTPNSKPASKLNFVAQAADLTKGNYHKALRHILVEEGIAYATDGKRLHYAPTDILEDGLYLILKRLKKELHVEKVHDPQFTFPNVQRVIPTEFEKTDTFSFANSSYMIDVSKSVCKLIKWLPEDRGVNIDHLEPLRNDDPWEIGLNITKYGGSILCKNNDLTVVIALLII